MTELLKNCGPLLTIWFDVPQETEAERSAPTVKLIRALQPDIMINNRAGGIQCDYDTPEQKVGGFNLERPWETCMTICRQWSWKPEDQMKPLQQCLRTLIATSGGNGNLLFNVGPMPDGRIEPRQAERLKEMGAWLVRYGESIYATRGGPFKPGQWGASTRKGNRIYLHVFRWDGETLSLPAIPAKVASARALTGGSVECTQQEDGLTLRLPQANQDAIDSVIQLEIDRPALELAPVGLKQGVSLASGAKAKASNVFQTKREYAAEKAIDGDENTRWATDAGTKSAWLELDLHKPATFSRVLIDECDQFGKRIRRFELQQKDGEEWKTFLEGTEVGSGYTKNFSPVTARFVRLNIREATEGPTIFEFQLFAPKK